jgi:hypothetical protein
VVLDFSDHEEEKPVRPNVPKIRLNTNFTRNDDPEKPAIFNSKGKIKLKGHATRQINQQMMVSKGGTQRMTAGFLKKID